MNTYRSAAIAVRAITSKRILVALTVVGVAGGIYLGGKWLLNLSLPSQSIPTYEVRLRTVEDTVIERGILESQNTVSGVCELPGWQTKIIFIVPEGTVVKKGDVVVKLQAEDIDQQLAQKRVQLNEAEGKLDQAKQELSVQLNKSESDLAAAELELKLAELDLEKYRDGDFKAEKAELERSIADGQAQLEKVADERNNFEVLVKKGYRSPEQLNEIKLRENSVRFMVDRDRQKLLVLETYDYRRKITEFEAKAIESRRKLERAHATAEAEKQKAQAAILSAQNAVDLHRAELKEFEEIIAKSVITAPQDGTVAYANQPWFDAEDRIKEGTMVRRSQSIFYLPDMTKMQVRINLHESVVNRLKVGQKATIRLDAFSDVRLTGVVQHVAELASSSYMDTKSYDTVVVIDSFPESLALKPGMTAEVEIFVGTYENIIAVPVGAVTEHLHQTYVYVDTGKEFARRSVKIGRISHSFIEIIEGLQPGERIALDAYQRGVEEFASRETQQDILRSPAAGRSSDDS